MVELGRNENYNNMSIKYFKFHSVGKENHFKTRIYFSRKLKIYDLFLPGQIEHTYTKLSKTISIRNPKRILKFDKSTIQIIYILFAVCTDPPCDS